MFESVSEKIESHLAQPSSTKTFFLYSFLILIILVILIFAFGRWFDVVNYFNQVDLIFNGQLPYSDFVFEYPPMSLPFMIAPRLFTSNVDLYCLLYSLLAFAFFIIGVIFAFKISNTQELPRSKVLIFAILTLLLANVFLITRNDIFPAVFCIIGLYCYLQKRYTLTWMMIALAAMMKLFPILLIPALLIPFIIKKDYSNILKCIIVCGATALIVSLPFIIADYDTAFNYLTYHVDRGLQIESVSSSFIMMLNIFDPGMISVSYEYGSDNIVGQIPDMIAPLLNYIFIVAFISFFVWTIAKLYRIKDSMDLRSISVIAILAGLVTLMIFLTTTKVFSTQFIILVFALLMFTQFSMFDPKLKKEIIILAIFYGVLSTINGDFLYFELVSLNEYAVLVIFLRNIVHILLLIWIVRLMASYISNIKNNSRPSDDPTLPNMA